MAFVDFRCLSTVTLFSNDRPKECADRVRLVRFLCRKLRGQVPLWSRTVWQEISAYAVFRRFLLFLKYRQTVQ